MEWCIVKVVVMMVMMMTMNSKIWDAANTFRISAPMNSILLHMAQNKFHYLLTSTEIVEYKLVAK